MEDYKSATEYYDKTNQLKTIYNVINDGADVEQYERDFTEQKYEIQRKYDRTLRNLFIVISVILLILIFVIFKLYQSNKKNHKLVEKENIMMRNLLKNYIKEEDAKQDKAQNKILTNPNLSDRQKEIIQLVKQGKTNKEIGAQLCISENTVKYHLKIIYNTLGIESRNKLLQED